MTCSSINQSLGIVVNAIRCAMRFSGPRLSMRGLFVLVSCFGVYLGTWELTKAAQNQVALQLGRQVAESPCPFIVSVFEPIPASPPPESVAAKINPEYWAGAGIRWRPTPKSRYYLWFFGWVHPTPFLQSRMDYNYRNGEFLKWYTGPPLKVTILDCTDS